MSDVFYCYSPNLYKELKEIGENYITRTVHPETNRVCWIYLFNDNLKEYLNNRPKCKTKYVKNGSNPKVN